MLIRLLISAALFAPSVVWSQDAALDNLDNSELEKVIEDFSALFAHTSVSGAGTLGEIFGFEVGLVAGISETPGVEQISKDVDPTSDISSMPHAGILGVITVPYGITAEINFLPSLDADDFELDNQSLAVKWTFSKLLPVPLDLAVKASYTASELSFTQDDPAPGTVVSYESTVTQFMVFASKNFLFVEPYLGVGVANADGELSASNSIFADASTSASKDISGSHIAGGVNLNLGFFKFGAEVAKVFEATKASVKLALYF